MRWVIWIALAVTILGTALIGYAYRLPVYTRPDATDLVYAEAEKLPEAERSQFWFKRLREFETPHKRLWDLGHGILAAGAGALVICGLTTAYRRFSFVRNRWVVFLLWTGAWLIRAPAAMYHYVYRQMRHDFPWWADSIGIPIMGEAMVAVIGGFVSVLILGILLGNRELPGTLNALWPPQQGRKLRAWLLLLWGCLLILITLAAIPSGDMGSILGCMIGGFVLAIALAAQREPALP